MNLSIKNCKFCRRSEFIYKKASSETKEKFAENLIKNNFQIKLIDMEQFHFSNASEKNPQEIFV